MSKWIRTKMYDLCVSSFINKLSEYLLKHKIYRHGQKKYLIKYMKTNE